MRDGGLRPPLARARSPEPRGAHDALKVTRAHADAVADADAGQFAGIDQVVHVAAADVEALGDLAAIEKLFFHVSYSGSVEGRWRKYIERVF
jgi:hypothetical protein